MDNWTVFQFLAIMNNIIMNIFEFLLLVFDLFEYNFP